MCFSVSLFSVPTFTGSMCRYNPHILLMLFFWTFFELLTSKTLFIIACICFIYNGARLNMIWTHREDIEPPKSSWLGYIWPSLERWFPSSTCSLQVSEMNAYRDLIAIWIRYFHLSMRDNPRFYENKEIPIGFDKFSHASDWRSASMPEIGKELSLTLFFRRWKLSSSQI